VIIGIVITPRTGQRSLSPINALDLDSPKPLESIRPALLFAPNPAPHLPIASPPPGANPPYHPNHPSNPNWPTPSANALPYDNPPTAIYIPYDPKATSSYNPPTSKAIYIPYDPKAAPSYNPPTSKRPQNQPAPVASAAPDGWP